MAENAKHLRIETVQGDPVRVGEMTVTPQARAVIVRFGSFGFVWNRPVAVLVERDGETSRLPVVDVTRLVQVGLLGFSLLFWIILKVRSASGGQQR